MDFVDLVASKTPSQEDDEQAEISRVAKETIQIRKVIACLAKNETVPFESTKLTRQLKNYFVGNCMTRMLLTVSGASSDYQATLTNLRYAQLMKSFETCP